MPPSWRRAKSTVTLPCFAWLAVGRTGTVTKHNSVHLMPFVVPIELLCLCVLFIMLMATFLAASAD